MSGVVRRLLGTVVLHRVARERPSHATLSQYPPQRGDELRACGGCAVEGFLDSDNILSALLPTHTSLWLVHLSLPNTTLTSSGSP